ncbi:THYG protein, partial [Polypterus senegalus]
MKGGGPFYPHPDVLQVLPGNLPPTRPRVAEVPAVSPEALRVSLLLFPPALPGVAEVLKSKAPKAWGRPLAVTMGPYRVELQSSVPVAPKETRAVTPRWSGEGASPPSKFEELQGRVNSKTAFYAALTNALGGENNNTFVHDAATWFYSMAHSVTPAGYNLFSRALENATRIDIPVTLDLQLAFGLPHSPQTRHLFNAMERRLSLQMMLYTLHFIKSGNPNYPYTFSKRSFSDFLPAWPAFVPHPNGDNFKVLDDSLNNGKGLRKAECSFWADYIQTLTTSTSRLIKTELDVDDINPTGGSPSSSNFQAPITKKKGDLEKDAYN